jgi:hypothetical protein
MGAHKGIEATVAVRGPDECGSDACEEHFDHIRNLNRPQYVAGAYVSPNWVRLDAAVRAIVVRLAGASQ